MSDESLKILIRKRGVLKARLTSFKTYLSGLQTLGILEPVKVIELEQRLTKVDSILPEFEELQFEIEGLSENAEINADDRSCFENTYFSVTSLGKEILSQQKQIQNADNLSVRSQDSNNADNVSVHSQGSGSMAQFNQSLNAIRLPTINLPKFSGKHENWLEFRDTFNSLIDTNIGVGEIQKFHYLRASLEGAAAQIIKSLEFSSTNYSVAWGLLCDRFDNKRLLVHNHVKGLCNLPVMKTESSYLIRNLLDTIAKHLRSLESLGQPTLHWDTLLIFIISNKLDPVTARKWESFKGQEDLPTMEDMKLFLKCRADLLETLEYKASGFKQATKPNTRERKTFDNSTALLSSNLSCAFCKEQHYIFNCSKFVQLSVNDRIASVQRLKLCINCLKEGHVLKNCRFSSCRYCKANHNSLLHFDTKPDDKPLSTPQSETPNVSLASHSIAQTQQVLLSTALINIVDSSGMNHLCRALLDSGSQSNFVTEDLCNRLKLRKSMTSLSIVGINQVISNIDYKCNIGFKAVHNSFSMSLSCFVLPKISENMPTYQLDISSWCIPKHLKLADPDFYKPKHVDILLGAEVFWNLMCIGQISLGNKQPVMQKTKLGYIISGPFNASIGNTRMQCNFSANTLDIQEQLSRFWEIEEVSSSKIMSTQERACESLFINSYRRNIEGRFIVSIPFKEPISKLGDSRQSALKRFYSLERKLQSNPTLKEMYNNFISEYESLGHMSKIVERNHDGISYYLPHHGVFKEDSVTTKLRVVFDGSAPSTSGWSLNDLQLVGPTTQDDLLSILLRFRKHRYVISADIAKMYRQVLIEPEFRTLHRIFWRPDPTNDISVYNLNTVTYGTASASFLAIRCLQQLAYENKITYQIAADTIVRDFYVDDLLTGAETIPDAVKLCTEIAYILEGGCFELRKWSSNSPQILNHIQDSKLSSHILRFGSNESNKTLGLLWACQSDFLMYSITKEIISTRITKRSILSDTAQIFDPLGLLSPCTVLAKIILQKLWSLGLSWDESVPSDLHTKWLQFRSKLAVLNKLQIPRHIICQDHTAVELHGFSDSSQDAYGGCIYIRSICKNKNYVTLLCAKSRVAPLKLITIPRLELCGALVLAQLFAKVQSAMGMNFNDCYFWCDSTVVLGWIRTQPNLLQTFVGNRVSEIQRLIRMEDWRHVPSQDNPADLLSRGVSPSNLNNMNSWWNGPLWLSNDFNEWPSLSHLPNHDVELPELRKIKCYSSVAQENSFPFDTFSTLGRLKRVVAYCLRFRYNSKAKKENRQFGCLTVHELDKAMKTVIKVVQFSQFQREIDALNHDVAVHSKSKLLNLVPFIDSEGLLRVGGRLRQSQFNFDKKHPIVLPNKHHFTHLIFRHEHIKLLHAGPQLLLSTLRDRFWPISGRNQAKQIVRECVNCYRFNSKQNNPIMGNLPEQRTLPMPPFHVTGVDYAGPFIIKDRKGRGSKTNKSRNKCYICLFVCFSTKAVHLELVTELTTEAFILTFRRFASRRGKPLHVYSDNGTNFVGANTELKELFRFLVGGTSDLTELLSNEGVNWHFIPAHSPHFGGLWEAGVKSTKHHLKRVMSNALLTFEEFYTILTQIESILNSRPLTPISTDPNDLEALTPAHFLVGRALTTIPDPDVTDVPENRLNRFQRLQQIQQHFWVRWAKEYISELQQRTKWKVHQGDIQIGTMVLIKDNHLPPSKWQLGRVVELHPGEDNVTRVVSVKTSFGVIKRALSKICALPIEK